MKAAMQGRAETCRALMLAGGDMQARDNGRGMTPREWALFTGRYETAYLMYQVMMKPCAEQFCDSFSLEWPLLEDLVAKAEEPKSCWKRSLELLSCCPYRFYLNNKVNPVDDGVLEHMVRITTGLSSPFIATACRTVCPGSPPCIGKRRYAVQEILRRQRLAELNQSGRRGKSGASKGDRDPESDGGVCRAEGVQAGAPECHAPTHYLSAVHAHAGRHDFVRR
uniref:Ankyrin repeat domain 33Bb n=1 Tax=Hippocampus comes TaxID=109280 RepID=A0A3Q2Y5Z0_HIPCM